MKAITIWQPYASLLACGAKKFETRGWRTAYRGRIAIHAAEISAGRALNKAFPLGDGMPVANWEARQRFLTEVREALGSSGDDRLKILDELPRGRVIATAELVGCHDIVAVGFMGSLRTRVAWVDEARRDLSPHYPDERELLFGDWTPGRYAWELADVRMLPAPVPAKGKQRIWEWEDGACS